jgi:transposase-like protein
MQPISYARRQFSPDIIRHAVWLYYRFTLSYRDVEELLAERCIDVSYESVRRWALKFGPKIAAGLIRRRPRPDDRWNLDEMVVRIAGRHMFFIGSGNLNRLIRDLSRELRLGRLQCIYGVEQLIPETGECY